MSGKITITVQFPFVGEKARLYVRSLQHRYSTGNIRKKCLHYWNQWFTVATRGRSISKLSSIMNFFMAGLPFPARFFGVGERDYQTDLPKIMPAMPTKPHLKKLTQGCLFRLVLDALADNRH